jgi:selenocysteine-specific elongation factor
VIVGTAGHIDHGKTTLVRALTGVDTDRLKEEKVRGISIELGYAYVAIETGTTAGRPLVGDNVLGFVDVPGHERLVHTMVAGASGIDFALLVIAADDGVMPQTREHLAILELLDVRRGAVALTKVDRVDAAREREAEAEIAALLAMTPLREAPVFPLDARAVGDARVAALRSHLHTIAATLPLRRDDGLFRLAIDRAFTLSGLGTMVTGTVHSGQVKVGDTLVLMPAGTPVRVRSIHAQDRPAEFGRAGQRCALNLAGVGRDEIERGNWVADARLLTPTTRIDVRLRLFEDAQMHVSQWSPLHVHLGTDHRIANAVPLDHERLAPGEVGHVQLVFAAPVCAVPGDRFIVRNAQATRTVGGGRVLDPFAPQRRRRTPQRFGYLAAIDRLLADGDISPLLQQAPQGLRMSTLMRMTAKPREGIALAADAIVIDTVADGDDCLVMLRACWTALRERVVAALHGFHEQSADEPGPDSSRLRRIAAPELPEPVWRALVDELLREGIVARNGAWLHLRGHVVTLSGSDELLAGKLLPLIAAGGFDPPWVRDLACTLHDSDDRVRLVLRKLVRQGRVFQIVPDLFYAQACVSELAGVIDKLAHDGGGVEAAQFRDAIGVGRKRAVQILEFFDRLGYTRRVRSAHALRSGADWFPNAAGGATRAD